MLLNRRKSSGRRMISAFSKKDFILPLLVVLAAAALRFFQLGFFSMWFDEAYSWHLANQSVRRIIELARIDNTPPVYHILLHFWLKLGAESDFAVRLLPAAFGIASIWMTYKLGDLLYGRKIGITAAIISAVSFQLVHYSQENRMYSLQVLLGVVSTYYFLLGLRKGGYVNWSVWILANAVNFYNHLFTVLLVFAQWLFYISFFKEHRKHLPCWFAANVILLLLYLPWAAVIVKQVGVIQGSYWVLPAAPLEILKAGFHLIGGTDLGNNYVLAGILNLPFLTAGAAGLYLIFKTRKENRGILLPLLFFAPMIVVYFISIGRQSLFYYRYFVFLLPYLHLIFAVGTQKAFRGSFRNVSFISIVGVSVVFLYYYYSVPAYSEELRTPVKNVTEYLGENGKKSDIIIHLSPGNIGMHTFYTSGRYLQGNFREYIWRDYRPPFYFGGSLYREEYGIVGLQGLEDCEHIWVLICAESDRRVNAKGLPTFLRPGEDDTSLPASHPDRLWQLLEADGYTLKDSRWFDNLFLCKFVNLLKGGLGARSSLSEE